MQALGVDRLGEEIVHAAGQGLVALGGQRGCRQRNDRQCAEGMTQAQHACGLVAAHHRHLHVHQHQREGCAGIGLGIHSRHRQRAVAGLADVDAPLLEEGGRDQHIHRVVFGDQDPQPGQPGGIFWQRGKHRVRDVALRGRQRQLGPEAAAPTVVADDADRAPHQLRELAADRQSQPGAAEAARGRGVGLRERREQPRLHGGFDARAGVVHFEAQP